VAPLRLSHDRGESSPRDARRQDARSTNQRRDDDLHVGGSDPHRRHLPVNSFLIRGEEPTVIDAGITPEVPDWEMALRELIDPIEIR
jgi:hypothetical protein